MNEKSSIFHAYDVRGTYPGEISEQTAYRIGWAFAGYLLKDLKKTLPLEMVLGLDMRGSSPFLARELIRGLNDQGIDVVEIGLVPTPAFHYAIAFKDYTGGIMVTASCNPKEYSGLKFCRELAKPIGFGAGLEIIQKYFESFEEAKRTGTRGKMSSLENMTAEYVAQDLSYVNPAKIEKLKIAADPANCMGALYLEELFKRISCDPIKVNWDLNGNMPVHEADPLKPENLRQIQAIIKNEKADFGIATDGDGDRIVFLDENAEVMPAEAITRLVGMQLAKKNNLETSGFIKEYQPELFGAHSFVGTEGGRYFFRENFYFDSPIFTIVQLLLLKSESGNPMLTFSELINK